MQRLGITDDDLSNLLAIVDPARNITTEWTFDTVKDWSARKRAHSQHVPWVVAVKVERLRMLSCACDRFHAFSGGERHCAPTSTAPRRAASCDQPPCVR